MILKESARRARCAGLLKVDKENAGSLFALTSVARTVGSNEKRLESWTEARSHLKVMDVKVALKDPEVFNAAHAAAKKKEADAKAAEVGKSRRKGRRSAQTSWQIVVTAQQEVGFGWSFGLRRRAGTHRSVGGGHLQGSG